MKASHRKAHQAEGLGHSTARSASAPRLKAVAKRVADYVVILLK